MTNGIPVIHSHFEMLCPVEHVNCLQFLCLLPNLVLSVAVTHENHFSAHQYPMLRALSFLVKLGSVGHLGGHAFPIVLFLGGHPIELLTLHVHQEFFLLIQLSDAFLC